MKENKKIGCATVIIALVLVVIALFMCTEKIKPGYVGIVYSLSGGVEDNVKSQGLRFKAPWKKINEYSVATEQAYLSRDKKEGSGDDDSFTVPTSDGKTVNVDLEFSYHFDVDKLPETFSRFKGQDGKTIEETFIRGKMKAWASEISSTFAVIDIYGDKRAELNNAVLKHVQEKFDEYGIAIDSVNFSRIELDEATAAAIQERINKQQELEAEKLESQKQTEINNRNIEAAEAQNKIKVETAKAEAEANAALQEKMTKEILMKMYIEKWNGELPKASGVDGAMFDMSSMMKAE